MDSRTASVLNSYLYLYVRILTKDILRLIQMIQGFSSSGIMSRLSIEAEQVEWFPSFLVLQ